jgi:hypothetical protein
MFTGEQMRSVGRWAAGNEADVSAVVLESLGPLDARGESRDAT